jgi:hypothetical protein
MKMHSIHPFAVRERGVYLMTNKWKTFGELIFLAIVAFPALHYLGIRIHFIDENLNLNYFNVAAVVAPVVFLAWAGTIAIFG